jgi:hypothetical protein
MPTQCPYNCQACSNVQTVETELHLARLRQLPLECIKQASAQGIFADVVREDRRRDVEALVLQLTKVRIEADNHHRLLRSPIDLQSLLNTGSEEKNAINVFEKQCRQEFYHHHTISGDRTGTDAEVASRILSFLGQKEEKKLGKPATDVLLAHNVSSDFFLEAKPLLHAPALQSPTPVRTSGPAAS